jgi:hypothetical protein
LPGFFFLREKLRSSLTDLIPFFSN